MKQHRLKKRMHRKGFTLLEVLLAMGIFAIGFVFIAAIFPVAALLQKEAADIVNAQQAARNTKATMKAMGITEPLLTAEYAAAFATDQSVYAAPSAWLVSGGTVNLTVNIRSTPTSITNSLQRKYYWVPFFRDTNPVLGVSASEVLTYVFVLQKRNNVAYPDLSTSTILSSADILLVANNLDDVSIPKVYSVGVQAISSDTLAFTAPNLNGNPLSYNSPLQLDIGDKFLDNNGTVYSVNDYDMTQNTITVDGILLSMPNPISTIWFASPGEKPLPNGQPSGQPSGKSSPTMDILILTGAVQ